MGPAEFSLTGKTLERSLLALLAAYSSTDYPLELVVTDGYTNHIMRVRGRKVIAWCNLTPGQAIHHLASSLKQVCVPTHALHLTHQCDPKTRLTTSLRAKQAASALVKEASALKKPAQLLVLKHVDQLSCSLMQEGCCLMDIPNGSIDDEGREALAYMRKYNALADIQQQANQLMEQNDGRDRLQKGFEVVRLLKEQHGHDALCALAGLPPGFLAE